MTVRGSLEAVRHVLILGAGQSAPFLIQKLLQEAEALDAFVTAADRDVDLAQSRVGDAQRGEAVSVDATELSMLRGLVERADLVVNFLSPVFQHRIARTCVELGKHMVSASYRDQRVREMDGEARRQGSLLVNEVGLDPGIDHMSAMDLISRVREEGGRILKFASYGSGVPVPGEPMNPLRYFVTWNPRNVVMAGEGGAQYLVDGRIKIVGHNELFKRSWRFEVPGVGPMEAYPNRDSLSYQALYGLEEVETMLRGTLRYPGWSEVWRQIVRLGLPNEQLRIPRLSERSWAELIDMFLPRDAVGVHLEQRLAMYLDISPTGTIIQQMRWLGLFDETPCRAPGETSAEALTYLLRTKLALPPTGRDMVILCHELVADFDGRRERILSTMLEKGTAGGMTAMAKTVGLPAALVAKLLLEDELPLTGSHIPTHPVLYRPLLAALAEEGIVFQEERRVLSADEPIS